MAQDAKESLVEAIESSHREEGGTGEGEHPQEQEEPWEGPLLHVRVIEARAVPRYPAAMVRVVASLDGSAEATQSVLSCEDPRWDASLELPLRDEEAQTLTLSCVARRVSDAELARFEIPFAGARELYARARATRSGGGGDDDADEH